MFSTYSSQNKLESVFGKRNATFLLTHVLFGKEIQLFPLMHEFCAKFTKLAGIQRDFVCGLIIFSS